MVTSGNDRSLAVVGAAALAAAVVFTLLFFHATSRTLGQKRSDLWLALATAEGLQKGDRVLFRGVQVGEVRRIDFDGAGRVVVRTTLHRPVPLTSTAGARLVAADIFGRQSVILSEGAGGRPLVRGDTLGATAPIPLTDRIEGVVSRVERVVGDSTVGGVHLLLGNAAAASATIDRTADAARLALELQAGPLSRLLRSTAGLADNLRAASDTAALAEMRAVALASVTQLGGVLAQLDSAAAALGSTARRVDAGEGSLGLLARDPDLYRRTVAVLESLELLLTDVREHPKRYINVRIF
jgi:phospholipid/cholesterol/gamma-HCH transport system substrate-binding protein